jgi:uncharacterized membrane protein
MSQFEHLLNPAPARPAIREIGADDLSGALRDGLADLFAHPALSLSVGLVYALIGGALVYIALGTGFELSAFPMASAFFLIGPVSAVGLYELSRRRQTGERIDAAAVFGAVSRNVMQIAFFGAMLVFMGIAWLKVAYFIYAIFFGGQPLDLEELIQMVFTTGQGIRFLAVGFAAGAVMAAAVFAVSVVGVPMLLDRKVDAVTAAVTSVEAVRASPRTWLAFAALIVFFIGLGLATFMVGLVVTLPLVGHATWHLYRRAVAF